MGSCVREGGWWGKKSGKFESESAQKGLQRLMDAIEHNAASIYGLLVWRYLTVGSKARVDQSRA